MLIDSHAEYLAKAEQLSRIQVKGMLGPLDVIRVLQREKISFVLVGAYGLVGWRKRARATEDVDLVVALKQVKKAVRVLQAAFADLDAEEHEVVVRLRNRQTGTVVIDVMKPIQPPYVDIFKYTHKVVEEGIEYRVPSVEFALATKFAALISLSRMDEDKYLDAHDFALISKVNPDVDFDVLAAIGDSIFPGGGKEIVEKVEQARAGQRLVF